MQRNREQFLSNGWPTAVLHWQALCLHTTTKAASWRTVVVRCMLHSAVSPQPVRFVHPLPVAHRDPVTCAARSCAGPHTMTPAALCNEKHCIMEPSTHHRHRSHLPSMTAMWGASACVRIRCDKILWRVKGFHLITSLKKIFVRYSQAISRLFSSTLCLYICECMLHFEALTHVLYAYVIRMFIVEDISNHCNCSN